MNKAFFLALVLAGAFCLGCNSAQDTTGKSETVGGLSPADNSIVTTTTPTFSWTAVPNAIGYELQIAGSEEELASSKAENVTETSYTPKLPLTDKQIYYWRIRAKDNGEEYGEWSITQTIRVDVPLSVTASEIAKRTATDIRDSYVIFRISAEEAVTDYHLAVEESSKAAPTAEEMASGALKRNLDTEPINVLIAQRLNAPMVAFAKKFFADNTHQTLGTGMAGKRWDDDRAMVLDDQAAGDEAWVSQSVLKPSTGYTLYGMQQDGSTVTELLTLNTDADSSSAAAAAIDTSEHIDTTLEQGHIEIAMHADEYYIFPLQRKLSPSDTLLGLTIGYSRSIAAPNEISASTLDLFIGELDPGFQGMLLLFNQKTSDPDTLTQGLYVLMRTDRLLPSPDDLSYFNMWCTIAQHPNESDKYHLISSNLKIQR